MPYGYWCPAVMQGARASAAMLLTLYSQTIPFPTSSPEGWSHLTHWGQVMPYGDRDLGHHWLREWLVAWRHQPITWTSVDLSSVRSSDIHLRAISQEIPEPPITEFIWKIKYLKCHLNFPGANELSDQRPWPQDVDSALMMYNCELVMTNVSRECRLAGFAGATVKAGALSSCQVPSTHLKMRYTRLNLRVPSL